MEKYIEYSIIVPVYNVEKYIEKCLLSIFRQSFTNYEVIIVNDGTKDNSRDIIIEKCMYDARFKLYDKENGGLSSARNEGLRHATGKYVLFIDSDDWIEENYLERIHKTILDNTDVLICKYKLDDTIIGKIYTPYQNSDDAKVYSKLEKEKEIFERHILSYPRTGYELKNTTMPVWKNVYRRDLIERNNLKFVSERAIMAEDYIFNMEAYFFAHSVQTANIDGYVHVIINGTLSRRYRENAFDMSIAKHQYVLNFLEKQGLLENSSLRAAEITHFAFSIASDMSKLCTSNTPNKGRLIKSIIRQKDISILLEMKMKWNLQFSLYYETKILYTKSPILYIIFYNLFARFNYLYRLVQMKIRK